VNWIWIEAFVGEKRREKNGDRLKDLWGNGWLVMERALSLGMKEEVM